MVSDFEGKASRLRRTIATAAPLPTPDESGQPVERYSERIDSPWRLMSSPICSASALTRSGVMQVDDLEDHEGHDAATRRSSRPTPTSWVSDLPRVAVDQPGQAVPASSGVAEIAATANTPASSVPEHAADAVDAEYVERVVIAEPELELGAGPVADAAGEACRSRCRARAARSPRRA